MFFQLLALCWEAGRTQIRGPCFRRIKSVFGQFTGQNQPDRSLDLMGTDSRLLGVFRQTGSFASNTFEDVVDERVHDAHGFTGDTGVGMNLLQHSKGSVLDRLKAGDILVGDGGMTLCLEKRGYVKAGPWSPECTVESPEAVRQVHREFLRAGADVIQAFTFSRDDDIIDEKNDEINQSACDLAKGVAQEGGVFCAGSICQTARLYTQGVGKERIQKRFEEQIAIFLKNDLDLLIAEFFEYGEEAEWVVEVMKNTGKPTAITMSIGPVGDSNNVSTGECAVKLARAGADIIGVNCKFDPNTSIETLRLMKEALDKEGLNPYLMIQPVGYHTPDAGRVGFASLPETPFALEPRTLTRWDVHKYARQAYDMGVRYIGGCCGFEPYHIRAIAEELAPERGFLPVASEKHELWGGALTNHPKEWMKRKANRDFWENLEPATGRPFSAAKSKFDGPA